ncbi:MAG: ASPIC/UnbV domain-containing protein [Verrucomicrobiaceae bacterium]
MRDDPDKPEGFAEDEVWDLQKFTGELIVPNQGDGLGGAASSMLKSHSLSGNERNRFFLREGDQYEDLTLISGVDFGEDGRGFARMDFDQDGYLDLVVTSLAEPRVRLMRNGMADFGAKKNVFTLDLRGRNETAQASKEFSNRDAIGARVLVTYPSGKKVAMQKQCGEGFSVQNPGVLRVTWGEGDFPVLVLVRWPSGKEFELKPDPETAHYELVEPK